MAADSVLLVAARQGSAAGSASTSQWNAGNPWPLQPVIIFRFRIRGLGEDGQELLSVATLRSFSQIVGGGQCRQLFRDSERDKCIKSYQRPR